MDGVLICFRDFKYFWIPFIYGDFILQIILSKWNLLILLPASHEKPGVNMEFKDFHMNGYKGKYRILSSIHMIVKP